MKSVKRLLLFGILTAVLFAVPAAVFANKTLYKARLMTDNELHEVIGSNARGSMVLGFGPSGGSFQLGVNNLSGDATAAHIHGPADETQNAPPILTLCGGPPPAAAGPCVTDSNGTLIVTGEISSSLLASSGITGAQFQDMLNNGLLYVNVHTQLNPAGEVRGQLYPH